MPCLLESFAARLGFLLLITFLLRSLCGCKETGLRDPPAKAQRCRIILCLHGDGSYGCFESQFSGVNWGV